MQVAAGIELKSGMHVAIYSAYLLRTVCSRLYCTHLFSNMAIVEQATESVPTATLTSIRTVALHGFKHVMKITRADDVVSVDGYGPEAVEFST